MKNLLLQILTVLIIFALWIIVCIALSKPASAQEVEIDVGRSLYVNGHDDWWYQSAFEHKLDYRATTAEIGIHDSLYTEGNFSVGYGAAWDYLGEMHMQSYAVPDSQYSLARHSCLSGCSHADNFSGAGHSQGISLTIEPSYELIGYEIGFQAGAYIHKKRIW